MNKEILMNISQNRKQITDNYFPTDRGLRRKSLVGGTSYHTYFRTQFFDLLKDLDIDDCWLDVGAGELYAQREYLTLEDFKDLEHARIAVVSVKNPGTIDFKNNYNFLKQELSERFLYRSGQRIEDIDIKDLPKAKLVSDLFAALSFSEQVDVTIKKELDILEPGGNLISKIQRIYIKDDDKRFGIKRYLQSIKGARLEYYGFNTLIMNKISEEIIVPELEMTEFLSYKNVRNPKNLDERFLFCERYYRLK